jgi:hypothetical protein
LVGGAARRPSIGDLAVRGEGEGKWSEGFGLRVRDEFTLRKSETTSTTLDCEGDYGFALIENTAKRSVEFIATSGHEYYGPVARKCRIAYIWSWSKDNDTFPGEFSEMCTCSDCREA